MILDGISCEDGSMRSGYISPFENGISECTTIDQMCVDGQWQGPHLYETCDNPTEPCGIDPHGSMKTGYVSPMAPCYEATSTCIDGMWEGPQLYDQCQ